MWVHRLSNINEETRTADCAECGPNTRIYRKERVKWRCAKKHDQHKTDNTPEQKLNNRLKNKYGITTEQRVTMAENQEHRCLICFEAKPLVVDHDHETGKVRGLLCFGCNSGLGFFRDNPTFLRNAVSYLSES